MSRLMSTTSIPSARTRVKARVSFNRFRAWLVACAIRPEARLWLVIQLAILHAVIWTFILINLKAAQDVHMDVAEAYGWGQEFLWGYGKHPPLSGWVAGLWFKVFPAADWATYALAMATVGVGMVICWLLSLRVVDARRAFLVVVMVALYPIFNFKGFKYNPDLLQLVTLPLLVLAYLNAFEKRTWQSGIWFGLAGALALMTKYWVLTMIGAIGLAALIHPDRLRFLLSPAPWVAIATMVVAMIPHIVWLAGVHFVPLTYAGDTYSLDDSRQVHQLVAGYALHNLALLALPVALAALAMALVPHWFTLLLRAPLRIVTRAWARGANPGVNVAQALNVWIIQIIVAVGPPLGALAFSIYMKTDWGISLFFLVPLGAGRDPGAAGAECGPVQHRRDLARAQRRHARRLALDRRARDGGQCRQHGDLRRALGAGARIDAGLAHALRLALGGRRRHHGVDPADGVLQPRPSGRVDAARSLGLRADVARGCQEVSASSACSIRPMAACRRSRNGSRRSRRTPSAS